MTVAVRPVFPTLGAVPQAEGGAVFSAWAPHSARAGRRREFRGFAGFARAEVPDPQTEGTFARSRLDRGAADDALRAFYRELIALRPQLPRETTATAEGDVLHVRRGRWELVADLASRTVELRRT